MTGIKILNLDHTSNLARVLETYKHESHVLLERLGGVKY